VTKKYEEEHKEQMREYRKRYAKENKEHIKEYLERNKHCEICNCDVRHTKFKRHCESKRHNKSLCKPTK